MTSYLSPLLNSPRRALWKRPVRVDFVLRRFAMLSWSVASGAMAQSVLAPLPTTPGELPVAPADNAAMQGITTGAASGTQPLPQGTAAIVPGSSAFDKLLTWGELHMKTHVTYQFLYGSGIQSSPGQPADTITQTVNPGVAVALGRHWTLDYEPSFTFFSERQFHNTFDQTLSLVGGAAYENWTFGLSQTYIRSDQPIAETASQTGLQSYSIGLNASYNFSEKWSVEMGGGASFEFVDQGQNQIVRTNAGGGVPITNAPAGEPLSDSQSYFASQWINYQFNPKIGTAMGLTEGYTEQTAGLNSVDEELLGRITLRPGTKLTISADGGIEYRQFLNSTEPNMWTPIFAASAAYHLFEPTVLSLSASRSVSASLFQNQVVDATQVSLGLQQRLLRRLQLSLSYSYGVSDYIGSIGPAGQRNDVVNSYQAGFSMEFLRHGSIGTFYQYSQNSSSQTGFGYSSNQVGFTLTWAY